MTSCSLYLAMAEKVQFVARAGNLPCTCPAGRVVRVRVRYAAGRGA